MVVTFLVQQVSCKDFSSLLSRAIDGILLEFFAKVSAKIDVVYLNDKRSLQSEEVIKNILSNNNDSLTFNVTKLDSVKSNIKLNASSVVVFGSAESFRKMYNKIVWQTNPKERHQHLVSFPGAKLSDLENIQDGFSIDNVNFLVERKDSIKLLSSFMFKTQTCRKNQFETINRFDGKTLKWETLNFYPNKYQNLGQCELYFREDDGPISIKLHKAFTNLINATATKLSEKENKLKSDLFVDPYSLKPSEKNEIMPCYTNGMTKWVVYIPPGELYTPFEKMFLPFDFELWIAIVVTLSAGFVSIQIISYASDQVKKFVFGRDVKSPTMNFISIILVGSQVKTAGRNFARFIFTLFVIWCVVIRTCYQSKMFELLQSDPKKPEMQTIDELFERNFTFFIWGHRDVQQITQSLFENSERKVTKM